MHFVVGQGRHLIKLTNAKTVGAKGEMKQDSPGLVMSE